jgi:hypothetical protein
MKIKRNSNQLEVFSSIRIITVITRNSMNEWRKIVLSPFSQILFKNMKVCRILYFNLRIKRIQWRIVRNINPFFINFLYNERSFFELKIIATCDSFFSIEVFCWWVLCIRRAVRFSNMVEDWMNIFEEFQDFGGNKVSSNFTILNFLLNRQVFGYIQK